MTPATAPEFILVVGCPRSGTHLLASLLGAELGVAIPVETHLIPLFHRSRRLYGDLASPAGRRRLLTDIYGFLELFSRAAWGRTRREVVEAASLLATRPQRRAIAQAAGGYGELVEGLFREFARLQGMERWGDKSVPYRPLDLEVMDSILPRIRVLHLVRDGRDVALSWRRTWFGPATLAEAARLWSAHVERYEAWGARHPERYLAVRFEELVRRPDETVARLGAFLGLPRQRPAAGGLADRVAELVASEDATSRLGGPPDPRNAGRWRRRMAPFEQRLFLHAAGPTLERLGYDTRAPAGPGAARARLAAAVAWGRIRSLLSAHRARLALKGLLPRALFLSRALRLPLVRWAGRWAAARRRDPEVNPEGARRA